MADQPNIKVRVDESGLSTSYTNGFRHHVNNQEVIIDFGTSTPAPQNTDDASGVQEMVFRAEHRLAMNYVSAKRLAGLMVQIVQAYEQRNGEIKAD